MSVCLCSGNGTCKPMVDPAGRRGCPSITVPTKYVFNECKVEKEAGLGRWEG